MPRPTQGKTNRSKEASDQQNNRDQTTATYACVERTVVYQKLPMQVRTALDEKLLNTPSDITAIRVLHNEFDLMFRYGVTDRQLLTYRKELESFLRPFVASLAISALLETLPKRIVARLGQSRQVLIWSRLVQHLTDKTSTALSVNELARLAALLSPQGRNTSRSRTGLPRSKGATVSKSRSRVTISRLADISRQVYGIDIDSEASGKAEAKPS